MVISGRKGAESFQSSANAAFLILLITVAIIFYILFLPPSDRASLLDDGTLITGTSPSISGGYEHLIGTTPFSQNIGHINYISDAKITHDLSSFTIFTQTDANKIADMSALYVKNSAFEKKGVDLPFTIDKRITNNVKLSFNVAQASGSLMIYLNGNLILEDKLNKGSPTPINIPTNLLKDNNILHFTVSSPGFAFWTMNEYSLKSILLTGDITDDSHNFNVQKIYLGDSEFNNFKKSTMAFYPDCIKGTVGELSILLNGNQVFKGVPDCNLKNFFEVGKSSLRTGDNNLEFISYGGSYIIDLLKLDVELNDPEYPIYYFNLNEDLFISKDTGDSFCGKVDGVCPANCNSYEDKDCCFDESNNNYWCDMKTNNPRDRCVNQVLASFVNNCPSGYEDRNQNPDPDFAGLCGDDTDGVCLAGCSAKLDKDCCYQTAGNYWCDDVPFTGQDSICTPSITASECSACPNDYTNSLGKKPNCPTPTKTLSKEEAKLKSGVKINLESYFADKNYKKVDFIINGYTVPVDTYNLKIYRNINEFVHEGTNSIKIQPRNDITISQVRVKIA